MKIETCYYIAKRTADGLLKIVREEIGPYYSTTVLITDYGYNTREEALAAVEGYVEYHKEQYGWAPRYSFIILEELTTMEDE